MTKKEYLQAHPEKYVMVTSELGSPVYIAPVKDAQMQFTTDKAKAEIWTSIDNTPQRLAFHRNISGLTGLQYEQI